MENVMKAIVVKPGEPAVAMEIDGSLSGLQELVGGPIQACYPFPDNDNVCLICNDDGKLMGLDPNRALRDQDGDIYDIVVGNFLIIGLSEENFASLTPAQEQTYMEMFKTPQQFVMRDGKIEAIPITGKMTFDEFREKIIDEIKDSFAYEGKEVIAKPKQVEKAGGSYAGISVSYPDSNVAICVNLETAYEQLDHSTPEEIAATIYKGIKDGFQQFPEAKETEHLMEYSWAKERLAIEAVSEEQVGDFLKHVPSKNIGGDLYAIYRIQVNDTASTVVNNSMLEAFGVSPEQLHADALASSEKNFPLNIRPMGEVLGGFYGQDGPNDNISLFVCTSENRSHGGAGVIGYSDFPEKAAEKIDGNFYILPSSLHEVLIIPEYIADREALEGMVKSINACELRPEDILSDRVYHYDVADKKLELASDYEAKQQSKTEELAKFQDAPKRKGR